MIVFEVQEAEVPVYYEQGVVGDPVYLPCDISIAEGPHENDDSVVLVLWYREELGTPIYSVDVRERDYKNAERWSDEKIFGPRAYFITNKDPAQLAVDHVKDTDEGTYRCRVDFKFAQTRNSKVVLTVIVPPQKVVITDETGKTKTSVIGPFSEDTSVTLTCTVSGARPGPEVAWYRNEKLMGNRTYTGGGLVSMEMPLGKLGRSHLHDEITCQASNNNRTQPLSAAVQVDMNFSPLDVRILETNHPLTAGRKYELICQSSGSRPPAKVTWWKDGRRLDKTKDTTSVDGNTTTSILTFTAGKNDAGRYLSCKSENPFVNKDVLETGWKLEINYLPETKVILGASLRPDLIKEGVDVYFDCLVNALPLAYKVEWKLNGRLLHHNIGQGVIISNQSLVLQRVSRYSAGNYTCKAYNTEGEGESTPFYLNVMFIPICKYNQTRVYGVAKLEKVNISCEVEANPTDVVFKWSFNNSAESVDVSPDFIAKAGTTSIVSHRPTVDMDYGTLVCYASNKIGQQAVPCVYHIISAGKPERVSSCSVWNVTLTSFSIKCSEGYNGGMPQAFLVEVSSSESDPKINISSPVPRFNVVGLQPGNHYIARIYAVNLKGRSEPTEIEVTMLGKNPERTLDLKESTENKPPENFRLTTTMSIVIGVALSLIVVACIVAAALQVHCSRIESRQRKKLGEANVYGSSDSVSSGDKGRDLVEMFVGQPDEEKDPDIIPQPASDIDEHKDYVNRRQHVSTIDANLPPVQNMFAENSMLNRSYPSYCTLRNGTKPLQNFSNMNNTNFVVVPKESHQYTSTLPRRAWTPNTGCSDNYRYPPNIRHPPLSCAIPEEEASPSATPLISPKQESTV